MAPGEIAIGTSIWLDEEALLVDTSVWIDHLRRSNARLQIELGEGRVRAHPQIIGELACGRLDPREEILELIRELPQVEEAEHREVFALIETHELMGSGIGWVDAHLLASSLLTRVAIWTLDKPLVKVARRLGVYAEPG